MMNYDERDPDLDGPECISLSLAGKLIAVLEIFCYVFGYYYFEDYFGGDQEKLIILATILGLMTLFSISLLCGVVKSNRLFITPWIWVKGTLIFLQVLRFVSLVVDLSLQEKVGTAPLYELLFFGYNIFTYSIVRELTDEIEERQFSYKQFQYYRVI